MPKGSKSGGSGKRGDSALYKGMGIKLSDIVVGGESSSRASFAALDSGGAPPRPRLQLGRAGLRGRALGRSSCSLAPPPPRLRGESAPGAGGGSRSRENGESDISSVELTPPAVSDTLGTGTFSRVRIARHKASGKYTALKILKKVRRPLVLALVFAPLAGALSQPLRA